MNDPSLIISILAFAVSAVTFYVNLLKRADLDLVVGDSMGFAREHDGVLLLMTKFTVINKGALPGALVRMLGSISTKDGSRKTNLLWNYFIEHKDVGKEGETFIPWHTYAGPADVISLPGRATVTKGIQLITEDSFDLTEGDYVIEFVGLEGPKRRESRRVSLPVHVSSEAAQYLREECTADPEGDFDNSLRLTWS